MFTFAMVCNNQVIEVLYNQEKEPNWPPDPNGNLVVAILCDNSIERGMSYSQETNEFFWPVYTEPEEPEYVENEYEQYYNMVNAAILGGE